MPIYLYRCDRCERDAEELQTLSADPPDCCGEVMRRLPTSPSKVDIKGVHSKGYNEGYKEEYKRRLQKS